MWYVYLISPDWDKRLLAYVTQKHQGYIRVEACVVLGAFMAAGAVNAARVLKA